MNVGVIQIKRQFGCGVFLFAFALDVGSVFSQTPINNTANDSAGQSQGLSGPRNESADRQTKAKFFPGSVSGFSALVRKGPTYDADVLVQLNKGDRVAIVSQTQNWFKIRLRYTDGREQDGWVEKILVQLERGAKDSGAVSAVVAARSGEKAETRRSIVPGQAKHMVRVFAAPVFGVYRYGVRQTKIGGAYDRGLSETLSLGIPISYSTGGDFDTVQTGLDLQWSMIQWTRAAVGSRLGVYYEYLEGNHRSFMANTIDIGVALQYWCNGHISLYFEPVSVEFMAITTKRVPSNIRVQIVLGLRGEW